MAVGIVLQRLAGGVAHIGILSTVHGHIHIGVVIDGDAPLVFLPRLAAQVVLILQSIGAEHSLRGIVEHVAAYGTHLVWTQCLPVVVAFGGVLHHLYFRQVAAVGKGLVANHEVERKRGILGVGAGVLEVECLQLRAALEGHGSDAAQKRMVAHETRQVAVYHGTV